MKYICLLILLVCMRWTWAISNSEPAFSMEQQQELQGQIEKMITDQITEERADVKNVLFQQMYLEVIRPQEEVKAHFRYKIEQTNTAESTEETFEGLALLRSNDNGLKWVINKQSLRSPHIEFQKGLNVNLRTSTPEEKASEPKAEPVSKPVHTESGH